MFKDLRTGFFFGIGFAVSTLIIYYAFTFIYSTFLIPDEFKLDTSDVTVHESQEEAINSIIKESPRSDYVEGFHEMSIDDQIEHSSMILAGRYVQNDEGLYEAVVEDVLRNTGVPGFQPGDIVDEASTYSPHESVKSSRFLVFYTGGSETRKPRMQLRTYFDGDRITSLKSIPYDLFKSKCEDASQSGR